MTIDMAHSGPINKYIIASIVFHVALIVLINIIGGVKASKDWNLQEAYRVNLVAAPSSRSRSKLRLPSSKDLPDVPISQVKSRSSTTDTSAMPELKNAGTATQTKNTKATTKPLPKQDVSRTIAQALSSLGIEEQDDRVTDNVNDKVVEGAQGDGQGFEIASATLLKFQQSLKQRVQDNWVPPLSVQESKQDLKAEVLVRIASSGKLIDTQLLKASGHTSYDRSVVRAVERSFPISALPVALQQEAQDSGVVFRFHNKEVQ